MIPAPAFALSRQRAWRVALLLVILAVWSVAAWRDMHRHVDDLRREQREDLAHDLDLAQSTLTEKLIGVESLLQAASAQIRLRPSMTAEEWRQFVEQMDLPRLNPSVQMIGVIAEATPASLDAVIAAARRTQPDFTVFPAGVRDEYFLVTLAAPAARAHGVIGYDFAAEQKRQAALSRARSSGETTMTEPLRPLAGVAGQREHLLFAPLDDGAQQNPTRRGWVFLSFRADVMIQPLQQLMRRDGVMLTVTQRGVDGKAPPETLSDGLMALEHNVDLFGRNWILRAATPQAELLDDTHIIMDVLLHLSALLIGCALSWAIFHRKSDEAAAPPQVEVNADQAIARARMILDASPAVVYARGLQAEDSVTFVSNSVSQFGFNPDDLALRTDWLDVAVHPADRPAVAAFRAKLTSSGGGEITYRLHDAAGDWRWVTDRARIIYDASGDPVEVVGAISDVNERIETEQSAQRLSYMLALLSAVNELVAKEGEEAELIGDVCRAAVQVGGFRMVWFGELGDASGRWVRLVGRAGLGVDRLDDFHPSTKDHGAPWAFALNDGAPAAISDAAADPALAPWRDALVELGVNAMAALPIRTPGRPHACLTLYSEDHGAFADAGAMELLARLVENLHHGLAARKAAQERRLIAEQLTQSEERFRLAFEVSPYIVALTERDTGRILVVNAALRALLGFDARPGDILPLWADPMDRLKLIQATAEQKRVVDMAFKMRRADGAMLDGLISSAPLTINGVDCLMSIIRDVTHELRLAQEAEAERRKYRTIVEAASEGYWLIDAVTKATLEVNEALAKIFGYTPQEMLGRTPLDFSAPRDRNLITAQINKITTTQTRRYEAAFLRKDGREIITRISASTLRDAGGRAIAGVAFVSDVTAERIREREFERLRARLRLVLDAAGEAVIQLDVYGHIALANHAAAEMLGASEGDLIGLPWWEAARQLNDDGAPMDEAQSSALIATKGGAVQKLKGVTLLRPDGVSFVVDGAASPLPPPGGAVLVLQDASARIEAQRTMEEREEIYRQMFQRNTAIKLLIDPVDGRIIDANSSAAKFYGYDLTLLKQMKISDINTLSLADVKAEMAAAADEQRSFFRFKHRLADGQVRDVEVYSGPVRVAGKVLLHSIVTDVTERNSFEERLKVQAQELERSNADLQQFAYVASHDLRQPLRIISSYIALLNNRLASKLAGEEAEFLSFISDGAKHLDALIIDLLEYSRVGRGAEAPVLVQLNDVVREAAGNLGLDLPNAAADFTVRDPLPVVMGHRDELLRLCQNLIANAIKYRRPDRRPAITVIARSTRDEDVVGFSDNGIGVREEHFERIFQIFQRLHSRDKYEGTGVGLAICRKIMQRHGGRIWIESTPEVGSTFLLAFPREEHSK